LALHRLLIARGLYRGRERVSTALACLYAAARYRRVPYEPLEFLVLAARLMRSRARRALRAAEEAWVEAGRDGVRRLMRRLGEEERLVLRALRADEGPRAPYYVHRRWARRFMSLYRTIALEVYGRSPPRSCRRTLPSTTPGGWAASGAACRRASRIWRGGPPRRSRAWPVGGPRGG